MSVPRYHSSQRGGRGLSSREGKEEEVMEGDSAKTKKRKIARKIKEKDEHLAKGQDRSRRGGTKRKALTWRKKTRDEGGQKRRESRNAFSSFSPSGHQFEAPCRAAPRPAGHPSQPQPESNEITRIYIL